MSALNYTPCYASRKHEPIIYAMALATLLAGSPFQPSPPTVHLDLSTVAAQIDRAATVAAHIISDNVLTVRSSNSRDEYLESKSLALSDTYMRAYDLNEFGHFDGVETAIGAAVLERARSRFQWPEAADARGLALLDMHLRETANAIRPLLAKQADLLVDLRS